MTSLFVSRPTPTKPSRVVAVIVTHNRLAMLKHSLANTLTEPLDKVIVINNASNDGTREWLDEHENPLLEAIHLPVNGGGAGGFHHGFNHVIKHHEADWLVCYDDDAFPQPGSIATFKALELMPDVAGVAAAVYLPDGRISEMNRPSRDPFASRKMFFQALLQRRAGFHVLDNEYLRPGLTPIGFSSFVGCFLRTSAMKSHLGLPRRELFVYADDVMYTHKIGRCGLVLHFAPEITFIHDCRTLYQQMDVYKPLWKVYYATRNRVELFRQIAGPAFFYPVLILKVLEWIFKMKYYEKPISYLTVLFIAIWHGLIRDFSATHDRVISMASR